MASKWDNHVGAGQCSGWKGLRIEATVEPLYKNIVGNHLYILIGEVFLCKGNSLFCLEKS